MLIIRKGVGTQAAGFQPTSSQSSAFLARATATGVTSNTDKQNYDTLITGLVNDGVFAKLDLLYIYSTVNRATAVLNLIQNAFNCTETGTINFTPYQGYLGDGSTFFLDTTFNPATAGGHFSQDSCSLGLYCLTTNAPGVTSIPMGVFLTSNERCELWFQLGSSQAFVILNSGATTGTVATTTSNMFLMGVRTGPTTEGVSKNGGALNNGTSASVGISSGNIYVFASNEGSPTFCLEKGSGAFVGGGLTNTDVANISSRVNTFMTAYGINQYP